MNMKARLFFALFAIVTMALPAQNVLQLSIDDVIRIAKDSAYQSLQASAAFEAGQMDYESYVASRKWQLGLNAVPRYDRFAIDPVAMTASAASSVNALSAGVLLTFEKQLLGTGGSIYATSDYSWSRYAGDVGNMFGTTPLRIGYRHELLGFNGIRWDERQQKLRMDNVRKEYAEAEAAITESAVGLFFDYASSCAMYEMYRADVLSADSLYRIGQEKYAITSIRKDELISLELQLLNAQNSMRSSRLAMDKARLSLLSFIGVNDGGCEVVAVLPELPKDLPLLDCDEAIRLARQNNPVTGQAEESVLQAERAVDRTSREKGLQMDLDVSVGLQKFGYDLRSTGSSNELYAAGNVTLSIPLVDHGMRRKRHNAAVHRLEQELALQNEADRVLSEEVSNAVRELQLQWEMLSETKRAKELADESFADNQYNYAQGLTDINTFTLAQNRKDEAYINYIGSLSNYWLTYYRLRRLVLTD